MKVYPMLLTKEQVNSILEEAQKRDEFDYMLFLTLKMTGRRIGELYGVQEQRIVKQKRTGLTRRVYINGKQYEVDVMKPVYRKVKGAWKYGVRVADVKFEKGTMRVVTLKTKKKEAGWSEVNLSPENQRVIYAYIKKNRLRPEDKLFRKKGRSLRQIQQIIKKYAKLAGIPLQIKREGIRYSVSCHSFRHFFITELKRLGWTDDKVIKITGHKSANTLRTYDHIVATDLKKDFLNALKEL